jgi:tetratricopeptide (TPR) repeat protein
MRAMSDAPETLTFDEEVRAAQAAEAATLWEDAVAHYESALTQLPPSGDEAALLTALGACYWNLSEARTAWRTLLRAITLYGERGDGPGMARATLAILRIWGPPERHRTMAESALDLLGDGEPHLRAWLLARIWRLDEALRLADEHGFDDVRVLKVRDDGWAALKRGDVDGGIARWREAHARYVAIGDYQAAADMLRMSGFNLMQAGAIHDGDRLAAEAVDYARGVHLRFQEQLAQLDRVGVAFAVCEFDRCEALLGELTVITDFRADLFRMWTAELRGDSAAALALMVDPARAGGTPTAMSQIHAAAARTLFRAGREDAAHREMHAWADVARRYDSMTEEAAALIDCLTGIGGPELVTEVREAYAASDAHARNAYSTLQGRGTDEIRGALALRIGDLAEAERWFSAGASWAAGQRCPLDEARCMEGLAGVASARGDRTAARAQLDRARAIFASHGAAFYVRRVDATLSA